MDHMAFSTGKKIADTEIYDEDYNFPEPANQQTWEESLEIQATADVSMAAEVHAIFDIMKQK